MNSHSPPSAKALQTVRPLLQALSSARQVYALYADGHPNRATVLDDLLARFRDLRDALGDDPVLFVTRHSFYLGPTLLARESLSLYRLVEGFERARIEALEVFPQVSTRDVDALVRVLMGEQEARAQLDGIALNRVQPWIVDERADETEALRRGYAMGLELLREASVRVGAGRPVDMSAATKVVDQLATLVAEDPAQALLLTTVKSYDEYTYYHMVNVCLLSIALGHAVGLHHEQVVALGIGGLLHDVGKLNVPEEILIHAGALSQDQWRTIQRHPVDGAGFVLGTREGLFHPAATVVLEHHAAYDLTGYPRLTRRPRPSLPARLVAVADCFDAVTSKRSYRRAEERRQALNIITAGSGRGFDPSVVRMFVRLLGLFPIGSLVRLTSGEVGVVVRNHDEQLGRPTVRLVLGADGSPCDPDELDLSVRGPDDEYRWEVGQSLDPDEIGIDIMAFVAAGSGQASLIETAETAGGLVHEPSHGERPPSGYVDTHREEQHRHDDILIDPDVAPPFPED